jgi:PKD repeat protein
LTGCYEQVTLVHRRKSVLIVYLVLFILTIFSFNISAVLSISEPIVTPRNAKVSETVVVEGREGDVAGGTTVILYLDTLKPWDGTAGALNATSSIYSGYYNMTFKVPEIPGGPHWLIVEVVDLSIEATTMFTVIPQLNLFNYLYFDQGFLLEGDGFADSASVMLMMIEKNGNPKIEDWPESVTLGESFGTGDGEAKTYTKTLSNTPLKPGTLRVTDGVEDLVDQGKGTLLGSNGGSGTIDYVSGVVQAKFKMPQIEDAAIICDYSHFDSVPEIHFVSSNPVQTNSRGAIYKIIEVDSLDLGEYYFCALDSKNNTIVKEVLLCPKVSLGQTEVDVGDILTIRGESFTSDSTIESVRIFEDSWAGEECQIVTPDPSTDSNGDFQIQVFVPQVPEKDDSYMIEVVDGDGLKSLKSFVVNELAWIECSLERGDASYKVHLMGKNYQNKLNQPVKIELIETDTPSISYLISTIFTTENGAIDTTFVVTTNIDRRFTVRAYSDEANIEAETYLQVTPLTVELSKYHGLPGESIKITGKGFTPKKSWNATFDDIAVVSTEDGKVTSTGTLRLKTSSARFKVPEVEPDEYSIRFTDVDTGYFIDVQFTVDLSSVVSEDNPPIAIIECEETGLEGELFYFSGISSVDSDGAILYYFWEFGDGFSSNAMNPIHKYSTQGTYQVTLSVKDNDGFTDKTSTTIQIKDRDTRADFIALNSEGFAPLSVQFQEKSVSFDDVKKYEWDFGNGYKSNDRNPSHTYLEPGRYTVQLTIIDVDGDTFTTTKTGIVTVWALDYESPEIINGEAERINETDILVTAFVVDNQEIREVSLVTDESVFQLTETTFPGLYRCRTPIFYEGKIIAEDVGGNTDETDIRPKSTQDNVLLSLFPGWNKVVIPLDCPKTFLKEIELTPLGFETVSLLNQSTEMNLDITPVIESVWTYDPYIGYMLYDPYAQEGEFNLFEPGRSYWIKVTDSYPVECLLTCS